MKPVRLNRPEVAKARAREQRKAMSVGEQWSWATIHAAKLEDALP